MNMLELMELLLLKNRTIVSQEFEQCMMVLAEEIPLEIHRYPTDMNYDTWVIPPQWDVIKAELSDGTNVIASYADHPLFLAPYSRSLKGWVSHEELLQHVRSNPEVPDAFVYEHRLAYDYQRRLKDWVISLPHNLLKQLDQPRYFVDIQVKTQPGHMLVGESRIHGEHSQTFVFLSHLCHPGQANDGLTGVIVGIELMKRIRQAFPQPKYSYSLLIMPETIGSAVYVANHVSELASLMGAIFFEMPGSREQLRLKYSRRRFTYLDRVMEYVMRARGVSFDTVGFHEPYGNDEKVFGYAGIGVPALSLQRYPLRTYHTSADDLAGVDLSSLEECVDLAFEAVKIIERDYLPHFLQRTPVYLSRYTLYADAVQSHNRYLLNSNILELAWAELSAFDIACQLDISPEDVMDFLDRFVALNLVEAKPLTPAYTRLVLAGKGLYAEKRR